MWVRPAHNSLFLLGLLLICLTQAVLPPTNCEEAGEWVGKVVGELVSRNMGGCSILIVVEGRYLLSASLEHLYTISEVKQVINLQDYGDKIGASKHINKESERKKGTLAAGKGIGKGERVDGEMESIVWGGSGCRGYVFIIQDPQPLFHLATEAAADAWDYDGRYLIVGLNYTHLQSLIKSKKGRKTPHLAAVVKVVTFNFPPTIFVSRPAGGELHVFGRDAAVVRALAGIFNFTADFVEPPEGELWGERLENNTWNGIVGMLGSGKGDLGIANIFVTNLLGRNEQQQFSSPYHYSVTCCLIKMPPPLPRWRALWWPFQTETWLVLLVCFLINGLLLFALSSLSFSLNRQGNRSERFSFATSCFSAFAIYFREPKPWNPMQNSLRLVTVFLCLYGLVVAVMYSCNLTAFLTVTRQPPSLDTFKDLHGSSLKLVGLGTYYQTLLKESGSGMMKELSGRFVSLTSTTDVHRLVLSEQAVYLSSNIAVRYDAARLNAAVRHPVVKIMKECAWPYSVALAYQSNSPLKTKMDRAIYRIFESGLVRRWTDETLWLVTQAERTNLKNEQKGEKNYEENGRQENGQEVQVKGGRSFPLSLDHMQGAFMVLGAGFLCSLSVFVAEMLTPRHSDP